VILACDGQHYIWQGTAGVMQDRSDIAEINAETSFKLAFAEAISQLVWCVNKIMV